jgi:hypothetical protein
MTDTLAFLAVGGYLLIGVLIARIRDEDEEMLAAWLVMFWPIIVALIGLGKLATWRPK